MYEWIKSGNKFADAKFRDALVDDPVLAALIEYLAKKGIIDAEEFRAEVNKRCQAVVSAQELVMSEEN